MGSIFNRRSQNPNRSYLRNHATRAERTLWSNLKGRQILDIKFRRQFGVGNHILDFYCPQLRLAIEVDGVSHQSAEAAERDSKRQITIERYGIRFLRFTDDQVLANVDEVLRVIEFEVRRIAGENLTIPWSPPRK